MSDFKNVLVVGGGSFGTALANLLAHDDQPVNWWVREDDLRAEIKKTYRNVWYQPDHDLSRSLVLVDALHPALSAADLVVTAIPSQVVRGFWKRTKDALNPEALVVSASKGIEEGTGDTVADIMNEVLGEQIDERAAFLSGPTFAKELLAELPSAAVVAAHDPGVAQRVQERFATPWFRTYWSDDVTGVELGGSVKNIMAIAAGIVDGLGFGSNARAALITRGLAEIRRLGVDMGAQAETFAGLAGMGDLVLTCTGDLSRNRSVGLRLGRGETLAEILDSMLEVAEGVRTTRSVYQLAAERGVEMPIVEQVHAVLYEDKSPKLAIRELMARSLKAENE